MKIKIAPNLLFIFGTLAFLFVVLPVFFVVIPYVILSSAGLGYRFDVGAVRYIGLVPIALGIGIYLWCSHNFVFLGRGTPLHFTPIENLVVTGLYRYVRNPMYIGALLIVAGEALLFQSFGLIIYALASFGVLHLFILHFEEPHLAQKFGDMYIRYCKQVGRWIPHLTTYRTHDSKRESPGG